MHVWNPTVKALEVIEISKRSQLFLIKSLCFNVLVVIFVSAWCVCCIGFCHMKWLSHTEVLPVPDISLYRSLCPNQATQAPHPSIGQISLHWRTLLIRWRILFFCVCTIVWPRDDREWTGGGAVCLAFNSLRLLESTEVYSYVPPYLAFRQHHHSSPSPTFFTKQNCRAFS